MSVDLYGPQFFVGRSETVTRSARAVVPVLMALLEPASVLDVGCGQGEWVEAFAAHTPYVLGVDIAAPLGPMFRRLDLTKPISLSGENGLVVCLEVGEHLPEEAADTLIDTLTLHGDTIVFGAAVPGQEGTGHINCQPHEYWHEKFAARGYVMGDDIRPLIRDDPAVSPWYRNNMFVYRRLS